MHKALAFECIRAEQAALQTMGGSHMSPYHTGGEYT